MIAIQAGLFLFILIKIFFSFGWLSCIYFIIGYGLGLFIFSFQILPIYEVLYSVYLIIRKRIRFGVLLPSSIKALVFNFLVIGGFFLFQYISPKYFKIVDGCEPFNIGQYLGLFTILVFPLVKRDRATFLSDYISSYSKFLK